MIVATLLWAGLILFALVIGARVIRDCTKPLPRNRRPHSDN